MAAPTAEPVEERVLADVEATLVLITTTSTLGDFYSNVKRVHSMDRGPLEAPVLPALVLVHQGTKIAYGDALGTMAGTIDLEVYCVLTRNATWRRDTNRLAADVMKALRVDERRGEFADNANAFDTTILGIDVANESEGFTVAMARIDVQVQFFFLSNDPTVAA